MFSKVPRGTVCGRITIPNSGGLAPKCTTEDTMHKLLWPEASAVPTKFALLNPDSELIKSGLS